MTLVRILDEIAEQLEARGSSLAKEVDAHADSFVVEREGQFEQTGFDEVMKRDPDVAEKIYEERIPFIDPTTQI